MNRILLLAAVFCGATLFAADDFDRTSAEGAARIVLGALADEICGGNNDAARTALFDRMAADPGKYRECAKAREDLRDVYRAELSNRYAAEADKVLKRLARGRKLEEAYSKGFIEEVALPQERIDDAVAVSYSDAFGSARREACERQAQTLSGNVHPTAEEFERLEQNDLKRILGERVAANQKTPVFEENLDFINGKFVEPMLKDAEDQRRWQRDNVKRMEVRAFAPSVGAAELAKAIAGKVENRKASAKTDEYIYEVFPSVTNVLAVKEAQAATLAKASAEVEAVEPPVGEVAVRELFDRESARFIAANSAEREFRPMMIKSIASASIDSLITKTPVQEKEETKDFLEKHRNDGAFAQTVARVVDEKFMPVVRKVRTEWWKRQFKTIHPSLENAEWFPDYQLVDELAPRHDWQRVVMKWRELNAMDALMQAEEGKPVWEETLKAADEAVKVSFERGRSARAAQHEITEKMGGRFRRNPKELGDNVKDFQAIVEVMLRIVGDEWQERRDDVLWSRADKVPENSKLHFTDLFPSVRKRIEELAKIIQEELQKQDEKPPEEPPEEKPPEDPPPPKEKMVLDCALIFKDNDKSSVITTVVNGTEAGSWTCRTDRANYRDDIKRSADKVKTFFDLLLRKLNCGSDSEITVKVEKVDDGVYYRTVRDVVEAMRLAAEDCGIENFTAELDVGGR